MIRGTSFVAALALITLAAACGGASRPASEAPATAAAQAPPSTGQRVLADATVTDFALRDQNGKLVRLSRLRGHVVLLTFLYTNCRDVCPLIAEHLQQVVDQLGPGRRNVRIVAVSVDPAGDTRSAVKGFISSHRLGPEFSYLTGTRKTLQPVWQAYNVLSMRRNASVVDHSAPILLLDRRGRARLYYTSDFGVHAMLTDVRRLLPS